MNKIIGHREQLERLKSIIKTGSISNAYIFEGISGIGKLAIAKEFAEEIMKDSNYILIQPEENLIKVDVIRSLREELMLKPTTSDRKVAVIDDAECMNEQAQNALLKMLEEPPEYATIILVTSNKEKLLYTIKSRCITFKFNPLTNEDVRDYFNNNLDEEVLEYSRGSIGTALKIQNSDATNVILKWVNAFNCDSLIDLMKNINSIKEEKYVKENLDEFLDYLLYLYYKELKNGDYAASEAIQIVEMSRNNISKNANIEIAIDRMSIDLWKWRKKCKK